MKTIRWILTYPLAIAVGATFMLWLHNLSGQLIPEAALELLPLGDQEAMKSHILALPASAKWSVMFSHWLGTASAAAVAMILAPVSLDWIKSKPTWLATLPGSVMGLFFLIGGDSECHFDSDARVDADYRFSGLFSNGISCGPSDAQSLESLTCALFPTAL